MSSPSGYNNLAYSTSSLYDYEYVPEIDPESPNPSETNRRLEQTRLVHPNFIYQDEFSGTSDEFDNSDDSNRSVIVEECNNRRITMICDKRPSKQDERDGYYPNGNHNAAYYQEVSLESEVAPRSQRHQQRLDPPAELMPNYDRNSNPHQTNQPQTHQRPPRPHRYEEIPVIHPGYPRPVHRYAEISTDENGYPSLEKEVHVEERYHRGMSFSPTFSPSRTYQRTISPHPPELRGTMYSTSPLQTIEMSELSPPRSSRQPPIGASSPANLPERQLSMPNSPRRPKPYTPSKCHSEKKNTVTQIFHIKPRVSKPQIPTRRNICSSFTEPKSKNPYQPTTEAAPTRTAIITPILQRRHDAATSPRKNFEKASQIFQSTGNILAEQSRNSRMKRNQSVPNFTQSFGTPKKSKECPERKLEYQYSPAKSMDRFSPLHRSRCSLIDQSKSSWSNSEFQTPPVGCLILAAIVQLVTGIASCTICFYLLSKVGRKYYLDFGVLASFVSVILGALGFRSHCWRWLPNRNYVSGYIVLAAFSIVTCGGLVFLITAKPMSGDPLLDMAGGAICGISVLTIIMAITGLTMSGCCKTPPPDNRVMNL